MNSVPVPPASRTPKMTVIAARARNNVIGAGNGMPWHVPEELKHFKATTMGGVLVMGRKTFDSIGRPLPGRLTIVISRNLDWSHEGCRHATSLDEALAIAAEAGYQEVFIAGGAQVYEQAMPRADRLIITEIDLEPEGDTWLPAIDTDETWRKVREEPHQSSNGTRFAITEYLRAT